MGTHSACLTSDVYELAGGPSHQGGYLMQVTKEGSCRVAWPPLPLLSPPLAGRLRQLGSATNGDALYDYEVCSISLHA